MENTAKNFALQLGSLITLYISIGALIGLLFSVVTVLYPDPAQGYWEYDSASSNIRFTIAMLVVFFPAYIVLTRLVNTVRRTEHGTYLTLTKWLIYLSLLVGGGVLLGDFVAVLNGFLNGELTTRFVLKALTVFFVTGTGFTYYLLDARGHWQTHEKHSVYYAMVVTIAVAISLITGFNHTQSPAEVREKNIDAKQVTDLQMIQGQIESYMSVNNALPETLENAYSGLSIPFAPENRTAYEYTVVSDDSFKLCADFVTESSQAESGYYGDVGIYAKPLTIRNPNDWNHGKGNWCYTRVLNTQAQKLD